VFRSDVITDSLGIEYVGIFESLSFIVAVLAAYPYAYISKNFTNGRHWVMQFGSLSFLATGAIVFFLSMDELEKWYIIFAIKTVYGLGRGVFEGSCRAIYAEVFGKGSPDDLSTAFSGQTLLAGISGGAVYFLSAGLLSKEGCRTTRNFITHIFFWFHSSIFIFI
jgi:MFS family permease